MLGGVHRLLIGSLVLVAAIACSGAAGPAVIDGTALIRQEEEGEAYPAALGQGTLVVEQGCLAMAGSVGPPSFVLWPPSFALRRGERGIEVVDGDGNLVAGVGEPVQLGGGWMDLSPAQDITGDGIPARCRVNGDERYFIAGPGIAWELDGIVLLRHRGAFRSAGLDRIEGKLGDRNGCVALFDDEGIGRYLLWPRLYTLTGGPSGFQIYDAGSSVVTQRGAHLTIGGSPVDIQDPRSFPGGIPDRCWEEDATYWVVGELSPR
jgi:hypothetical protein